MSTRISGDLKELWNILNVKVTISDRQRSLEVDFCLDFAGEVAGPALSWI